MFMYTTTQKFTFTLVYHNLAKSSHESWLACAAEWAENKWGYLRGFKGVDYRKKVLETLRNDTWIVTYADQPIAMFVLSDHQLANFVNKTESGIKTKELMYFYVDENFRGLGVGSKILSHIKEICKESNIEMIVFDTLNPNLNHFYEKNGAKVVCDGQLLSNPTTIMRM